MTVFRQVIAGSEKNKGIYFLCWLSPSGGIRTWLFSHTDGGQEETFESFVIESIDGIRAVPSKQRKNIEAITVSLDSENFDYVKSLLASNRVYQVSSTGATTPIAILSNSVVRDNQRKEHSIKIKFTYKESYTLNL